LALSRSASFGPARVFTAPVPKATIPAKTAKNRRLEIFITPAPDRSGTLNLRPSRSASISRSQVFLSPFRFLAQEADQNKSRCTRTDSISADRIGPRVSRRSQRIPNLSSFLQKKAAPDGKIERSPK
jgi:hypothetical protein